MKNKLSRRLLAIIMSVAMTVLLITIGITHNVTAYGSNSNCGKYGIVALNIVNCARCNVRMTRIGTSFVYNTTNTALNCFSRTAIYSYRCSSCNALSSRTGATEVRAHSWVPDRVEGNLMFWRCSGCGATRSEWGWL